MQLENYLLYLEKTAESNPDKVKKHLVKKFLETGIATKSEDNSGQLTLDDIGVDISGKNLTDQVLSCMRQSEKARFLYEEWEFIKDYKYSVLYTCDTFDTLLKTVSEISPLDNICENEYIFDTFVAPVAYYTDDFSFLKFNLTFAAMKTFLETSYNCSLKSLNLDFMVNVSKDDPDVKLIAQYMKLPSGGNAQLEVGNNQEYVLPFIGELKSLLADNQADLEKVPSIREALEQFMYEMEEMSDYPWIELLWENEIKTRSLHVKFVFNYMSNDYCLIQHYYSNFLIGMERMNHVVKYIVNHRNDDTKQTE